MSISYRIEPEHRLVYTELRGKLTVDDVRDFRQRLEQELGHATVFNRLIDARQMAPDFTPAEIRSLADLVRVKDQGMVPSRRAVVMEDAQAVALMQVFQAYTRGDSADYRVFRKMEDAVRWLAS
jgi:hypothetical protein